MNAFRRVFVSLILIFLIGSPVFSANLSIPLLELITKASLDNGNLNMSTRGDIDLLLGGGYKFGGRIVLNLQDDSLEDLTQPIEMNLKTASVVVYDLFGLPIDMEYFIGVQDTLGSGTSFVSYFGTEPFASTFRGYIYFPTYLYNGIHVINGTGVKFSTSKLAEWMNLAIFAYQDGYLGAGVYSYDIRGTFNFDAIKMETFIGATYPASTYGVYRGGMMFFVKPSETGEFLAEIGIPRWDPANPSLGLPDLYLRFEPRVKLDLFSIIISAFFRPKYFLQKVTDEGGTFDLNLNFKLGDIHSTMVTGGIEFPVSLPFADSSQGLKAGTAPYLSIVTGGVIWDFKAHVNLWPFDLTNLVDGYIGIRSEF